MPQSGCRCDWESIFGRRKRTEHRNRTIQLEIDSVQPSQFRIQVWDQLTTYQIRKWLPLNQKNLEQYNMLPGIGSKYEFLEKILTGNILSCAKGLGIHFDKKITCHITQADAPYMVKYKGVSFISFDLQFKCNVSLPNYIDWAKAQASTTEQFAD